MIKIVIEDIKGEYKYKKVSILKNDEIVDRFRIDHRLATEEQLRAHPLYGVRVRFHEGELLEEFGGMPGWVRTSINLIQENSYDL